ncbi:endonuclease/exonuclease/phosphatase family protein [Mesorhizobium sp. W050]
MATASFANWNIQRQPPNKPQARMMIERIAALSPDVVCLTEAFEGSTKDLGGFEISVRGVLWSQELALERKVVLWSREPWVDADLSGNEAVQSGGFVSAVTTTALGEVRVVGVCVPYHLASPVDVASKCPAWSQQIKYLMGLKSKISSRPQTMPMILMGDFNQYVPRIWGSKAASSALIEAICDLSICTSGQVKELNRPTIDHIALSPELFATSVIGVDEHDETGKKLSDHFGVCAHVQIRPQIAVL